MAFSVLISSGVEKFYSLPQFLTVLIFTVSMILSISILVFISSHMNRGWRKNRFSLFMISLIVFQFAETGLIVFPTPGSVHFWVIFNCIAIFFVTRSFLLFCYGLRGTDNLPVMLVVLIAAEALLYGLFVVVPLGELHLFSTISFNSIVPGPVFWFFLAESISWMLWGVTELALNRTDRTQKSDGLRWLILGTVLFCGGLFLHHFLFWDYSALILPVSVLLAILCWMRSFIRYNLFGLFMDSFEEIIKIVSVFIVVVDPEGRIITSNRNTCRFWNITGCETVHDLILSLKKYVSQGYGENFLNSIISHQFNLAMNDRLVLGDGNDTMYLSCSVQPVKYWRKYIAWMLTFQDISEEEENIKTLSEHEKILSRQYGELKMYQKTGLYFEAEKERGKIIQKVHTETDHVIHKLMDDCNSIIPDDHTDVERIIKTARQGLNEIRWAANKLKHLEGEKLQ